MKHLIKIWPEYFVGSSYLANNFKVFMSNLAASKEYNLLIESFGQLNISKQKHVLRELLENLSPEDQAEFIKCTASSPENMSKALNFGGAVLFIPFFIQHGVAEGLWFHHFRSLVAVERIECFNRFVEFLVLGISDEAADRFKVFLAEHVPAVKDDRDYVNKLDIYLKMRDEKISDEEICEIIKNLPTSSPVIKLALIPPSKELKFKILNFAVAFKREKVVHHLLQDTIILSSLVKSAGIHLVNGPYSYHLMLERLTITRKHANILFNDREWSELLMMTLSNTYKVASFNKSNPEVITLNYVRIESNIPESYKSLPFDILPKEISVDFPKNHLNVFALHGRTENLELLELILDSVPHDKIKTCFYCGVDFNISGAFLKAMLKSEDFAQKFLAWDKSGQKWIVRFADAFDFLDDSIDRFRPVFEFESPQDLKYFYEDVFEALIKVLNKTYLELFKDLECLLKYSSYESSQCLRIFFASWIKSDQWESLENVQLEIYREIFDYLANDFPDKVATILGN